LKNLKELIKAHSKTTSIGEKIHGMVVSQEQRGFLVDVGLKDLAFLPKGEVTGADEIKLLLKSRDFTREFLVTDVVSDGFHLVLSIEGLLRKKSWRRAAVLQKQNAITELIVDEVCKAGYRLLLGNIKVFLPNSQIHPTQVNKISLGDSIPVQIIEVNESINRLVCSNRSAILEEEGINYEIGDLKVGDIVEGYVNNITTYGALIDLGKQAGLLHISQISSYRVRSVEDIFRVGEKVKSMVIGIDVPRRRISLTTKKIEPLPGDMIRNRGEVMRQALKMAREFRLRLLAAELVIGKEEKN
jgi:small subunit ribosomal protein S1